MTLFFKYDSRCVILSIIIQNLLNFHILLFQARTLNFPANIYSFKVNNRNTRKRCEICSKLTTKTPERRQWRCSGVFLLTLNIFLTFFHFEQVNVSWFTICLLAINPFRANFPIHFNVLQYPAAYFYTPWKPDFLTF